MSRGTRLVVSIAVAGLFIAAAVLLVTGVQRGVGIFLVILGAILARMLLHNRELNQAGAEGEHDRSA